MANYLANFWKNIVIFIILGFFFSCSNEESATQNSDRNEQVVSLNSNKIINPEDFDAINDSISLYSLDTTLLKKCSCIEKCIEYDSSAYFEDKVYEALNRNIKSEDSTEVFRNFNLIVNTYPNIYDESKLDTFYSFYNNLDSIRFSINYGKYLISYIRFENIKTYKIWFKNVLPHLKYKMKVTDNSKCNCLLIEHLEGGYHLFLIFKDSIIDKFIYECDYFG